MTMNSASSPGVVTPVSRRSSFPTRLARFVRSHLTEPQVLLEFPTVEIEKRKDALTSLRPGYTHIVPRTEEELATWAELLNEEPSFGPWTVARIREELLSRLVPNGAVLILHEGRAIACGCAVEERHGNRKVAIGMYLYVTPKYRGRGDVAYATVYGTLYRCLGGRYDAVYGTTDPSRLSVLALHLSNGCRPVRRELISWYRWHRILKRLGPTLRKMEERKARNRPRREGADPAESHEAE